MRLRIHSSDFKWFPPMIGKTNTKYININGIGFRPNDFFIEDFVWNYDGDYIIVTLSIKTRTSFKVNPLDDFEINLIKATAIQTPAQQLADGFIGAFGQRVIREQLVAWFEDAIKFLKHEPTGTFDTTTLRNKTWRTKSPEPVVEQQTKIMPTETIIQCGSLLVHNADGFPTTVLIDGVFPKVKEISFKFAEGESVDVTMTFLPANEAEAKQFRAERSDNLRKFQTIVNDCIKRLS